MPSTVHQEYEVADGAKLTVTWKAERPATGDELALLARIAGILEGRGGSKARR